MPPITRSMTKRNIYSDLDFQSAEKPIACDVSTMPDSPLSSLLLDRGPGHSINSEFQNLEFSKFQTSSTTSMQYATSVCHNLTSVSHQTMESDCKDLLSGQLKNEDTSATSHEILNMLGAISSQMMISHQDLKQQNSILSSELQKVIADAEHFKQEMRDELLRLQQSSVTSTPVISSVQSGPVLSSSGAVVSPTAGSTQGVVGQPSFVSSIPSGTMSPVDFQTQMLALLNNTFSQSTTVINDTKTAIGEAKTSDSKSDWPKFSGDTKKFRHWYLGIMSQISISPWKDMYDADRNNVVQTTTNSVLNGKLYAKVIAALEGQPFQHMVARPHLRGNGILLLQELHQMYKPRCVPEVIAAKTAEFWGHTKRLPSETVDDYYNHYQELLADFDDADEPIPTKGAIRHVLFTLGSEFEPLQNNYRLGTISEEWKHKTGLHY